MIGVDDIHGLFGPQLEKIQDEAGMLERWKESGAYDHATGSDFLNHLQGGSRANSEAASAALREAGIPGSMFYDQMSRNMPAGGKNFDVRWSDDGKRAAVFDQNSGDVVQEFDSFKAADAWVGEQAETRTRNYIMFRDDLTYVDPARTDKRLWDQLPIGEPFRTVEK